MDGEPRAATNPVGTDERFMRSTSDRGRESTMKTAAAQLS